MPKKKLREVKIIDSKSIDHTFLNNDFLNSRSTNIDDKKEDSNGIASKNFMLKHLHQNDLQTRSRHKGRITGGQNKQSHSSVYE